MNYYWKTNLETLSSCKTLLRSTVKWAIINTVTQKELCNRTNDIFKKYTENSPRWLRNELKGYLDGLKDTMLNDAIIFAYEHKGKLYGTKKDGIFPHYDQSGVPLKDIHKLNSGLFYKSNGKPYFTK